LSTVAIGGVSGITGWNWNFGDPLSLFNNTSDVQNPDHIFTGPGTYNVQLIVTSYNGCRDTITKPVIVNPLPVPDFAFTKICETQEMSFTDQSFSAAGITTWNWNFGTGATSNLQNPTYVYPTSGLFNVTLTVTDANGCTNSRTKTVFVHPNPVAEFSWMHFCWNSITKFTTHSYLNDPNGSTLDLHNWNFGDPNSGANNTSTDPNPTHNFSGPGVYYVTLTVTTSQGCTNTIVIPVDVPANALPTPTHDTVCMGERANLYAHNPNPAIGTLEWFYTIDGQVSFLSGESYYTTQPLDYTQVFFVALRDIDGCLSSKIPVFAVA
jgi:PKD repeat protein